MSCEQEKSNGFSPLKRDVLRKRQNY